MDADREGTLFPPMDDAAGVGVRDPKIDALATALKNVAGRVLSTRRCRDHGRVADPDAYYATSVIGVSKYLWKKLPRALFVLKTDLLTFTTTPCARMKFKPFCDRFVTSHYP